MRRLSTERKKKSLTLLLIRTEINDTDQCYARKYVLVHSYSFRGKLQMNRKHSLQRERTLL